MVIDGPRIGPESGSSGVSQLREKQASKELTGPESLPNQVQAQLMSTDPPQEPILVSVIDNQVNQSENSKCEISKSKTSRNWKRIAREGQQRQIRGKISSPLKRMLEVSKQSKLVIKRQSLSPAGIKNGAGASKLKSPMSNRPKIKSPRTTGKQVPISKVPSSR
ncbi:hypothetical protein Q3G72_005305 [Acer saccharum]|nr:hypothetical protein Q3G72_005305 [Acer saccharum]